MGNGGVFGRGVLYLLLDVVFEDMEIIDQYANMMGELSFVQISDSHMRFNKPTNPDVAGTLKVAVDKINGLATAPEFMLHTGDISQSIRT
jgi:hypothetical protein